MAGELQHAHGATGVTLYGDIRNETGQVWNTTLGPAAFETQVNANWVNGDYAITIDETPADGYFYVGDLPAVDMGKITPSIHLKVGGAWAVSDPIVGSFAQFMWSGTVASPPDVNVTFADGDVVNLVTEVEADLTKIHGTALTETVAGYLAAAFKKLFDVASPVLTVQSVNQTGDCYSSAQRQQMAREAHGVSGTVWHVKYDASETMGNDALSWATADETAGVGVKTDIEAASAGDLVEIGAGTFALGNNVINTPDGVSVRGQGIDITTITSTAELTTGAIVKPPTNGKISDFTIHGLNTDGTFQAALGTNGGAGQANFTDSFGERLRLIADTDGFYCLNASTCTMTLKDSLIETKYDGVTFISSGVHVLKLFNTTIIVTGPSTVAGDQSVRCVNNSSNSPGSTIHLVDCTILGRDGELSTRGINNGSGSVYCFNTKIHVESAGTTYSVFNSGGDLAVMIGCDYDRSNTSGTITEVSAEEAAVIFNNLDHLALTATATADMTSELADNTILSRMLANGDTSAFDPSTDGLQPIRDTAPLGTPMRGTDSATLQATWTDAKAGYLTGPVALEATLTAIKGAGWTTETLVAIDVLIDAIKAKTDGLNFTGNDVKATLDGEEVTPTTVSKMGYALSAAGQNLVAAALLDLADGVETGVTVRQGLQRMAAVLAGEISGAGSGTEVFVGLDGVTTRVTVTATAAGDRTSVVYA